MSHTDLYSVSRLKLFHECRRKAWWHYETGIEPIGRDETPLYLGGLVHECLEAFYLGRPINDLIVGKTLAADAGDEQASLVRAHASGMMAGYVARYVSEPWTIVALEQDFRVHVPGTLADLGGRIDGLVSPTPGMVDLLEHKTAATVDRNYLEKLWSDLQILAYCWAQRRAGVHVSGIAYNVLRKPSIRLRRDETWEDYGVRCAEWCKATPDAYTRMHLIFTDTQIQAVEDDLRTAIRDWEQARRSNRWPRNRDACWKWGRACPFYRLCESGDDPRILRDLYRPRRTADLEPVEEEQGDQFDA
jgi:hypothetical protein